MNIQDLAKLRIGDEIKFSDDELPYKITGTDNERWLTCCRPHKETIAHCIVDLKEGIRGPDNWHNAANYNDVTECSEVITWLRAGHRLDMDPTMAECHPFHISHRNNTTVHVEWTKQFVIQVFQITLKLEIPGQGCCDRYQSCTSGFKGTEVLPTFTTREKAQAWIDKEKWSSYGITPLDVE